VVALTAATALVAGAGAPALASDTLPWTGESAVGPHQPYQHGYTAADLLRWDPAADTDAELLRARVPLQDRIAADPTTQRDPALPATTQMHTLAGDYGNAFFESHHDTNEFSQYLFSYWQYADLYGTWHGQPTEGVDPAWWDPEAEWTQRWFEFGMLNLPNPAYTNAAHVNGVRSLATIFFSDNDRGEQTFTDLLVRGDDGRFPVADKLTELARYFGFDGYFVNQEEVSIRMDAGQMDAYRAFMQQLRADGLYVQWYDSVTASGSISYQNQFNAANSPFVQHPEQGRVSDSIFLNYWWNPTRLTASRDHADAIGVDPRTSVMAGIEAGMYQFEQPYDIRDNLGTDGLPMNGLASLGADFVHADHPDKTNDDVQWETVDRERRWWTGSSTGTGAADGDWPGIASQIAERSVIGGDVFATSFNTGHGLEHRTAGVVDSTSEWGNINEQDVPVTWQWWLEAADSPLGVDLDHGPAYTSAPRFDYTPVGAYDGGSSLVLAGDLTADNTLRLYKTDLAVRSGTQVELTWAKTSATDDSELRVAAVLASDPGTVVELPLAGSGEATDGWRTGTVDLSAHAGDRVVTLGLVVGAGAEPVPGYQVNVGALRYTDGVDRTPAAPTGLRVDRLLEGTDEAVVSWDLADYDQVTGYQLFLDGTYLGGRYDETLYVKDLPASAGRLELRAVGPDGSVSAPATLDIDQATAPSAVEVTTGADGTATVSWTAAASGADVPTTVRLETRASDRYASAPFVVEATVPAGETSTAFTGVPVDGSGYVATLRTGEGTAVAAQGAFSDATLQRYPVCDVVWHDDRTVTLPRPALADWRYLRVAEQWESGDATQTERKSFAYTYSQPAGDQAIRGRTTRQSYTVGPLRPGATLRVALEDYAGNVTAEDIAGWTVVPGPDEECTPEHLGPDLGDDGRSTLRASEGEQPANGVAAHTVQVAVQDAFGNPVTGTDVDVELPTGLVAVDTAPADGAVASAAATPATTVSTGTTGVATLAVAAAEPGTYALAAAVAGEPVRNGAGVTVTFAPVGGPPVVVPEVPGGPGAGAGGVGAGVDGGASADGVAAPDGGPQGSLARTGATVAALLAAALAAVAAGWGLRRVARR
jgi:endo-beta-N-acetylglucosaminidase D